MSITKERFFNEFKKDQATYDEIHENILDGVNIGGANFIILMCAIIIASVGLNMNATAVIIGAMLISPLMGPIIAIGYSVGIYNLKLLKKSAIILIIEIFISITTATIYFSLSPISSAGSEILSRTSPNIWDVIIAFTGGIAGIIGITRKKSGNILPGVAIATALMPPLCTSGYGLATKNIHIFLGAGYLFFINSFFIALSTLLVVKFMKIPTRNTLSEVKQKKLKKMIIVSTILVTIPSLMSAATMVNSFLNNTNLSNFIENEMPSEYILNKEINTKNKTIDLVIIGNTIDNSEEEKLQEALKYYNFSGYKLIIQQSTDNFPELKMYLDKIKEQDSGFIGDLEINKGKNNSNSNNNVISALNSVTSSLQGKFNDITKVYSGVLDNELPVFIINHSKDYIDKDAINAYILSNPELKNAKIYFEKEDPNKENTKPQ
ncbi:TPA: TIGR00341 family protein [Clostridium perfringens]|uniref:TIGR00341 family protein n=1 Tax=Clostridium perfringens TaxID=1502 RepID=UPI0013E2ED50|nr:TIGR00341 family protein [Clostridium perfringens]EJT5914803.1 TIGR00341 family protein [Clostridium perfringens]MDM0922795.1 TIGR00341 family protein [Clostridium perfringens]MDM0957598.1 TIGR00341 family protein [Clostridium perfringens]MDM0986433.1 TIGR00341 family protein [Clostridium perfringens]MDU6981359.1 TIGR00341 family protein [Clostridium perfringens]